jgi:hypothetical protein
MPLLLPMQSNLVTNVTRQRWLCPGHGICSTCTDLFWLSSLVAHGQLCTCCVHLTQGYLHCSATALSYADCSGEFDGGCAHVCSTCVQLDLFWLLAHAGWCVNLHKVVCNADSAAGFQAREVVS